MRTHRIFCISQLFPRLLSHLSCIRKLLTRNIFASQDSTGSDTNKVAEAKADILNLISSDSAALAEVGWTFVELFRAQLEMFFGCTYVWVLLGMCSWLQAANFQDPLVFGAWRL